MLLICQHYSEWRDQFLLSNVIQDDIQIRDLLIHDYMCDCKFIFVNNSFQLYVKFSIIITKGEP